jgi:DNA repair protein RecN (Recombination protein N)
LVEAVFSLSEERFSRLSDAEDLEYDEDNTFIIKRSTGPGNKKRIRVNGSAMTVTQLRNIGNSLVDIHGPHDHQMLFSEDKHIDILDSIARPGKLMEEYTSGYSGLKRLKEELARLRELSASRERELDLVRHQTKELEQVPLDEDKYLELMSSHARINNYEKLFGSINELLTLVDEEEHGISAMLDRAFPAAESLAELDPSTSSIRETLAAAQDGISDLSALISEYASDLSFDPAEASDIRTKYDAYYEILKKYGPDIKNASSYYRKSLEKMKTLENLDHDDAVLRKKIKAAEKQLDSIASEITALRKKTAAQLKKTIENELRQLGISNVRFSCRIERSSFTPKGCDRVTFHISPNIGEELKPLADIASSGEAARVMLALKKALIGVDPVPILIFDEIDAQIGGRLGTVTGTKLKELSAGRQVILITHLPQIASFSDIHFKVEKSVRNKKTLTSVTRLEGDARLDELAHMMSGQTESGIAREHARDMVTRAEKM